MIVKSFKNKNVELLITDNEQGSFNVIRIVNNNESNVQSGLDYEDAGDVFDYWIDMEVENDK